MYFFRNICEVKKNKKNSMKLWVVCSFEIVLNVNTTQNQLVTKYSNAAVQTFMFSSLRNKECVSCNNIEKRNRFFQGTKSQPVSLALQVDGEFSTRD